MSWELYGDKKINDMLETDISKTPYKKFGCPYGCFLWVWVSKKTPRGPAG